MALEKTVLVTGDVERLLREKYGLQVKSVRSLGMGTANCRAVNCGAGDFFLKEYQSRFTREEIERECALTEFLCGRGFPAVRLMPLLDGTYCFSYNDRLFCLQEYIAGEVFDKGALDGERLREMGKCLGRLHAVLRDYPLPRGMGSDWLDGFSPDDAMRGYDALIAQVNPADPLAERILSDLEYKKGFARRAAGLRGCFDGITYAPTHGDFSELQVIFGGTRIRAVIDFSAAATIPAVWEIMRSYVQSGGARDGGCDIDIKGLCDYVAAYREFSPLSESDIAGMPYVYLYQLARSRYGYKEYIVTKSENRDKLIQFAFWRTNMCRTLEKSAGEIVEALRA